jgi:hypothetical protein
LEIEDIKSAIDLTGEYPFAGNQAEKKAFSESLSHNLAYALSTTLRQYDSDLFGDAFPRPDGRVERPFLGGFGYKKVDVSCATEQNGLMLAFSVKVIAAEPYGKNLKNRFGDLCAEATSLHMRQPYSVLGAFFGMPLAAALDVTRNRKRSTFERSIDLMRSIAGRTTVDGSYERFEMAVMMLFEPKGWTKEGPRLHEVPVNGVLGKGKKARHRLFDCASGHEWSEDELLETVRRIFLERNPHLTI